MSDYLDDNKFADRVVMVAGTTMLVLVLVGAWVGFLVAVLN